MKYILLTDARVNFPAGTIVDVSESEASRLKAFGIGKPVEDDVKPEAPKKAKKKG